MTGEDMTGEGDESLRNKKVFLRPAGVADEDFLLSVYASTRADELSRVPWNPEQKHAFVRMQFLAQKQHYAATYPKASHDIICVNGGASPVGRIYVDRGGEAFHILDITILPQHRNAGTGSLLLRQVMAEAAACGAPVTIYIERFNPALHLFEGLGFRKDQENGLHFLMKWLPDAAS
jgi:ribosomal protein S18 acetylase RimI-like enzyme